MWNLIEKSAEHINIYSTTTGQAWYLIVFVFRLIVVVTIGSSVYSDEQSAFKCSTKVEGCPNVCYDSFAKISHIRFWSFQLLALTSPVVVFHFYTIFMQGKIQKLKDAQEEAEAKEREDEENETKGDDFPKPILKSGNNWNRAVSLAQDQVRRRRRSVGTIKQRKVFNKEKLETIEINTSIRVAYLLSVMLRIAIEIIFLYLAFDMFRFAKYPETYDDGRVVSDGRRVENPFDLFWIRVPQLYRCSGPRVRWACFQHMLPGNEDAYVPCWVSRPWEKTIFLQYMNTLSVICLILAICELIQLSVRFFKKRYFKNVKTEKKSEPFPYERAPLNDYLPPSSVKSPSNDEFYNKNEVSKDPPNQPMLTSLPAKPASANAISDLASGKLSIEELRRLLKESEKPRKRGSKSTEPKRVREENAPLQLRDAAEPKSKKAAKTRFKVPYATQSLNRPPKIAKPGYSALYRLGSISFSQSEGEGGSGSDGSESSDGSELGSVSAQSANSNDFV